jgi:beta-1,2-mannobiose phosphorylase / 1,2-beta-oligomannan phosphorylase
MSNLSQRFSQNPILTTSDIVPSQKGLVVECVLNPGVFAFEGKTWLIVRVAERPEQQEGITSFPVMRTDGSLEIMSFQNDDPDLDLSDSRYVKYKGVTYLSTISHLRLLCSEDGAHFFEPSDRPTKIFGQDSQESFGIEDCRVSKIGETYYLTYTQVSESGVGVGLMTTRDWRTIHRQGMIIPPHNKDCALFEEPVNGKYYCFHRPSGIDLGGNFIWVASSPDLLHWGNHRCIAHTREGMWDSARIGAGAAPIKTNEGWLEIYHGANADNRYCLGALLLDRDDPTKVLARSEKPIFEPTLDYEKDGFFGNVVFTNGHLVDGDTVTMYYGASDEVICGATFSIDAILNSLNVYSKGALK